jgi:multimeric flavodoxin WrbA
VLFIIELDDIGENPQANDFLRVQFKQYRRTGRCDLSNAIGALVVVSQSECFTKSYARKFIYLANTMGCEFIGHPLVERVKDLSNFKTWAKVIDQPLHQIERIQIERLIKRLATYSNLKRNQMNMLVLHAGHKGISNTLTYWELIKAKIEERMPDRFIVEELHVEEGKITDCYGCSFETCTYYAMDNNCFYGGFVVESLFPALEKADIIVWICPNYNDAISAKLMAVINRLTALYRKITFNEKYILGVLVSGNSGNDTVAMQLIGALNINKGFRLPPGFAAMALANDPGDILNVMDINKRVDDYVNFVFELTNKIMTKS